MSSDSNDHYGPKICPDWCYKYAYRVEANYKIVAFMSGVETVSGCHTACQVRASVHA